SLQQTPLQLEGLFSRRPVPRSLVPCSLVPCSFGRRASLGSAPRFGPPPCFGRCLTDRLLLPAALRLDRHRACDWPDHSCCLDRLSQLLQAQRPHAREQPPWLANSEGSTVRSTRCDPRIYNA